jgi:aspartate-semialdehyde dehydrogenase
MSLQHPTVAIVGATGAVGAGKHMGLIANPNCVAIVAVVALWPLHQHTPIRRVIAATYQAASGAGAAAMEELRESTAAYLAGTEYERRVLAHPYAFNLFSHDTKVDPASGYNEEETNVAHNHFPMPNEASGRDEVLVGRIRTDVSDPSGCSLALFVAGDQLLKGAALNAVQIAERLAA